MDANIKIAGATDNSKYRELIKGNLDKITAKLEFVYTKKIEVILHDSRDSLNKAIGRSTDEWEVAFASMGNQENKINILDPACLEKCSTHKESEFSDIMTHELTHLVINDIAHGAAIPIWLSEGLSNWLCQDNAFRSRELFYIETDLLEKTGTPMGWERMTSQNIYSVSYLLMDYMIRRFSLEKVKELLGSLDKHYYYPGFQKTIKKVLGVSPDNIETAFVEDLISSKSAL